MRVKFLFTPGSETNDTAATAHEMTTIEDGTPSPHDTKSGEDIEEDEDTLTMDLASLADGDNPKFKAILGHTSFETAKVVEDYPYGRRWRCTMYYWIESRKNFGDRVVRRSINPKNNRLNKPHPGQYYSVMWLYENEIGHIHSTGGAIRSVEDAIKVFRAVDKNMGLAMLNPVQQYNLRKAYLDCLTVESAYDMREIVPESHEEFKDWLKAMASHIKNCAITDILNPPQKPDLPKVSGPGMRA